MNQYKSIVEPSRAVIIIEKSKFLSFAYPLQSESEAAEILKDLRKQHPFATHICYAFVADILGSILKSSDDGEPKGTAGAPILDVLRKNDLRKVLVAVVRYFGGIKLGAGGLIRAYSQSAAEVLSNKIATLKLCKIVQIELDFAKASRVNVSVAKEIGREYGESVKITFATTNLSALIEELQKILQTLVQIEEIGEEYCLV